MNEALERLRESRRADVTLPSGLNATIQLLRVQDFIAAGDVPMPVLEEISKKAKPDAPAGEALDGLSIEDLRHSIAFNDVIVRLSVVALEGEPVELTAEDVKLLDAEDCTEIVAYAMRTKALPGKAA